MSFVPMASRKLANSLFVPAFCNASTRARMFVNVASRLSDRAANSFTRSRDHGGYI